MCMKLFFRHQSCLVSYEQSMLRGDLERMVLLPMLNIAAEDAHDNCHSDLQVHVGDTATFIRFARKGNN